MQPLYHETNCQGVEKKADRIGRHDFRRCGKTRSRACFGKRTSSLVPISSLILSFRGGFSRRGICFSEFFRSLSRRGLHFCAALRLLTCHRLSIFVSAALV